MRSTHALVVGGSGMLAALCKALLCQFETVAIAARNESRIRAISSGIVPIVGDYMREAAFLSDSRAHCERHGAPDLLVAWIHSRSPELRRALSVLARTGGRFVQVLGSAHADPARPDRLASMRAVTDGIDIQASVVVLGFVVEATGSRWLTNDEISDGVLDAVRTRAPLSFVGTVSPWSARP